MPINKVVATAGAAALAGVSVMFWWRLARGTLAADSQSRHSKHEPLKTVLVIHDIANQRNIEGLRQSALCFRVDALAMIGKRKEARRDRESSTHTDDAPPPDAALPVFHFRRGLRESLAELAAAVVVGGGQGGRRRRLAVVGIEIAADSVVPANLLAAVRQRFPDAGAIALLPGNEGKGLSAEERAACDVFVCVPHWCALGTGTGGGAGSINVNTATAVVLHQLQTAQGIV